MTRPDYDRLRAVYEAATADTANGHHDEPVAGLDIVNWDDLYAGITNEDPIIEGLAYRGRWTAIAAPAKAGKSTLMIALATAVTQGHEPFDDTPQPAVDAIYCDAEMGRVDMHERLDELDLKPCDLTRLHYVDIVPKLNTVEGATHLVNAANQLAASLVIIDGLNGAVWGAEKDDTVWRDLYDYAIAPLKRAGIAVVTADNHGKDKTLGPRGSSVKLDKPDAIIEIARTDNGVKLTCTHRRTAAYPLELNLRLDGTDGDTPLRYRHTEHTWPAGTAAKADELDRLGVPLEASRTAARTALKNAGQAAGNEALAAALRFRRVRTGPRTGLQGLIRTDQRTGHGYVSDQGGQVDGQAWTGPPGEADSGGVCSETEHPLYAPPKSDPQHPDPFEEF